MISMSAFRDEMVKIAKDRAAKEMDKKLRKGDMAGAKRMGRVAHGEPGVGQSIAHGLQRSANRHMANQEHVHMGAGGIDPKARSGFGQFEQNIAARQAGTQAGVSVSNFTAPQQPTMVSRQRPAAPAPAASAPMGNRLNTDSNVFHTPNPEAAQWAAYHQDALNRARQGGVATPRPSFQQFTAGGGQPAAQAAASPPPRFHAPSAAHATGRGAPGAGAGARAAEAAAARSGSLGRILGGIMAHGPMLGRAALGAGALGLGAAGGAGLAHARRSRLQGQPQPAVATPAA